MIPNILLSTNRYEKTRKIINVKQRVILTLKLTFQRNEKRNKEKKQKNISETVMVF